MFCLNVTGRESVSKKIHRHFVCWLFFLARKKHDADEKEQKGWWAFHVNEGLDLIMSSSCKRQQEIKL